MTPFVSFFICAIVFTSILVGKSFLSRVLFISSFLFIIAEYIRPRRDLMMIGFHKSMSVVQLIFLNGYSTEYKQIKYFR